MSRVVRIPWTWSIVAALTVVGPLATANVEPPTAAGERAPAADDPAAAAIAFAVEHHPELVPLLERLRSEAPAEFAAAVADLERSRERLAKLLDRQPEKYEAALADWKISSRIRLALARFSTSPSATAERELRQLIRQRAEGRLAPLRAERDRISSRLEKIDAQLEAFDRDPDAAVAREFESLRSTTARTPARAKPGVPAAQPRAPQPTPATP